MELVKARVYSKSRDDGLKADGVVRAQFTAWYFDMSISDSFFQMAATGDILAVLT